MFLVTVELHGFLHAVPPLDDAFRAVGKHKDDFMGGNLRIREIRSVLELLAKKLVERSVIIGFVVSDTIVRFAVCAGSRRKQEKGGTKEGGQ